MIFFVGFAKQNRGESVKLHATLMNTRFRNEGVIPEGSAEAGSKGGHRGRQSINAKQILEVSHFFHSYYVVQRTIDD